MLKAALGGVDVRAMTKGDLDKLATQLGLDTPGFYKLSFKDLTAAVKERLASKERRESPPSPGGDVVTGYPKTRQRCQPGVLAR